MILHNQTPRQTAIAIRDSLRKRYDEGYTNIATLVSETCDALTSLAASLPAPCSTTGELRISGNEDARRITGIVARRYGFTIEKLRAKNRAVNLARVRHIAMYVVKTCTTMTWMEVGASFGGKNHATVMNAVSNVERWLLHGQHDIRNELLAIAGELEPAERSVLETVLVLEREAA